MNLNAASIEKSARLCLETVCQCALEATESPDQKDFGLGSLDESITARCLLCGVRPAGRVRWRIALLPVIECFTGGGRRQRFSEFDLDLDQYRERRQHRVFGR